MTIFQIYFIVAAAILLSKFLFSIYTFKYLKRFISENKTSIDERMIENSLTYSNLIVYHFLTISVKYKEYSDEMSDFVMRGTCMEIMLYILFALFWVVSVPCVLLCMLIGWFSERFEKFAKSILS